MTKKKMLFWKLRNQYKKIRGVKNILLTAVTMRPFLWSQKATLALEVSGVCNIRCPMCSYPEMKRKKGFMSWELFQKIVDDVVRNGHTIASLHFFGEPLMWPHLVKGIALLSRNGIYPRISTNGMLLSKELAVQLEAAGLKEIMVTIDTLIPEAYSIIRKGGDFEKVKNNIHEALIAAPKLTVSAQFMPTKHNKDETQADFDKEFGSHKNFKVEEWFVIRMNNSENMSQDLDHSCDLVDKRLCSKMFDRVDVLWDGSTVLCCLDYEGQLVTGNLNDNTISYSWMGQKAMELRAKILRGEWGDLLTCKNCYADHIKIEEKRWKLNSPPSPLSFKHKIMLKTVENILKKREISNIVNEDSNGKL